jgi:peroxiredoxin Q/BCP
MLKALFLMPAVALGLLAAELKPGMVAPAFEAPDQTGATVRLSDFKGVRAVVLYFYPKDGTPGCTAQACSLRDGYAAIQATGAVVVGVSADHQKSHAAFAEKYQLPFSLLADPNGRIISAYGVKLPLLTLAKRWTFVIDRQGVIRHVISDVDTERHDSQVLALLKGL